jgi:hypothetical protein
LWSVKPEPQPVADLDLELTHPDTFYLAIGENYIESTIAKMPTVRRVITGNVRGYKIFSRVQD